LSTAWTVPIVCVFQRRKGWETDVSYLSLWKAVARSEGAWSARKDKLEFINSKTRGLVTDRVRSLQRGEGGLKANGGLTS
jgi:hypothetical protein